MLFRSSRLRTLTFAALLATLLTGLALSAAAQRAEASSSTDCENSFDCFRLEDSFNSSTPFAASASFGSSWDISPYTLQAGERATCDAGGGEVIWGNNSAWFRFDGAVAGSLAVSASTTADGANAFPVLMNVYHATHDDPIDFSTQSDLPVDQCSAHGNSIALDSPVAEPVTPGDPVFVQLLAYCGEAPTDPCPNPIAAGPVAMRFTFTATDSDGDGIPDTLDACPSAAGPADTNGCPDADADGVPDTTDQCPTVPGPASNHGCPMVTVTDSDGDGVPDVNDKCPDVAGPASNQGCPVTAVDSDGDGVPDATDACPTTFGLAKFQGCPDTDGDGIPDNRDLCPTTFGPAKFKGCPDTDGDGIPDRLDKCPTVKGLKKHHGCPAPVKPADDTDHDGIVNSKDACPRRAGPAKFHGCPDTDGDGIPDNRDKCPTLKGTRRHHGCPAPVIKDSDHDGIPNSQDHCPHAFSDAAVAKPGARRGCPGAIDSTFSVIWTPLALGRGQHATQVTAWTVDAPDGSTVTLSCRGTGCPASWPVTVPVRHEEVDVLPELLRHGDIRYPGVRGAVIQRSLQVTAEVRHRGALSRRVTIDRTREGAIECETAGGRFSACA